MKNLFAYDFTTNTIIASKATLKKAGNPATPEYKALMKMIAAQPTFKVVRFFFLYRYLLENTCEGHTAKGEDIRAQYENHEFGSDIRSVYRDIHQLNAPAPGLDGLYDGRTKGYWLKTRLFSQSELQLIIDGIQSSKFITQAKARNLTQRIQKLTDAHTCAVLNR